MIRPEWYSASTGHADAIARDEQHPNWLRAYFFACARTDRRGHAHFAAGELDELLGVRSGKALGHVGQAVEKGLLTGLSNTRCLVLPDGYGHKLKGWSPWCDRHDRLPETGSRNREIPPNRLPVSGSRSGAELPETGSPTEAGVGVWDTPCLVVPEPVTATFTARGDL